MKGGNIHIHYGLMLSHLLLVIGFGLMLVNKFVNASVRKMTVLYSLVFIGISFFISFILSLLNPNLTFVYKIIYLVLVCIVGSLIILHLDNMTTENFCPTDYKVSPEYQAYYQQVMNRRQNDLMTPYKEVYEKKGMRGNTNVMPLKNNYFQ